jgi:hypothetical protein
MTKIASAVGTISSIASTAFAVAGLPVFAAAFATNAALLLSSARLTKRRRAP